MTNVYVSLEAEKCVLGSALMDAKCAELAAALPETDFTDTRHRVIHGAIQALISKSVPVDIVTLDDELSKTNRLPEIGGSAYLIEVGAFVPTTANFQSYVKILQTCHKRRILRNTGQKIINEAADGSISPDDLRDKIILGLKEIKTSEAPQIISSEQALENVLDRISEISKRPEDDRIATGIGPLDKIIRLSGSKLVVIAARPGVGKSAFAQQIARNGAIKGKKILYSALEMDEAEMQERNLASLSGVSVTRISTGQLSDEDYRAMMPWYSSIANMPIWYTTECTTIEKLRRASFQMAEEQGLDMIIVDYIQLMRSENKKQSRYEQVSDLSRELRLLSQEMKIPVVALSQLNRQSEGGTTKDGRRIRRAPTMAEARDSGSIEQDANIFLIIHDPEESEMKTPEDLEVYDQLTANGLKLIRIIGEKNRQGQKKFIIDTAFDGARMRFTALTRKELPHG